MTEQKVMLGVLTPFGPVTLYFTVEQFSDLVQALNTILDTAKGGTPVPQVFIDAFNKEENNGDTD